MENENRLGRRTLFKLVKDLILNNDFLRTIVIKPYTELSRVLCRAENTILRILQKKPNLPYLEIHMADHCNMNCKRCGHFSNIVGEEVFADLTQFKRDMIRLSELFDNIKVIRLMGGEPLLNKELSAFIKATRQAFPNARIRIASNGLLIRSMPEELSEAIRLHNIRFDISVYLPLVKNLESVTQFLDEHNLPYALIQPKGIPSFAKSLNLQGNSDVRKAVKNCGGKHCTFLSRGRISRCRLPHLAPYFNKRFNQSLVVSKEDMIDIYDSKITGHKINSALLKPMSICRYCTTRVYYPWETADYKSAALDDWRVK